MRITEIYRSIQGESSFAGLPCVFVRTTGCPLRCRWCDTAYAFYGGTEMSSDDVLRQVGDFGIRLVQITGGEPLAQKKAVLPLMTRLCDTGYTVLLETSGAFSIDKVDSRVHIVMDIKCPDSGEQQKNRWDNLELLKPSDEVKFVLASRDDYEYARDMIRQRRLSQRCQILLSTVFDSIQRSDVVEWMLRDKLQARFQLQMHKFIWSPERVGV